MSRLATRMNGCPEGAFGRYVGVHHLAWESWDVGHGPVDEVFDADRTRLREWVRLGHEQHALLVRKDRPDGDVGGGDGQAKGEHVDLAVPQRIDVVAAEAGVDEFHVGVGMALLEGARDVNHVAAGADGVYIPIRSVPATPVAAARVCTNASSSAR
jgi:hypothetical protein